MSFYATIAGTVTYDSQESFDAALKLISGENGWLNKNDNFIDENGNTILINPDYPDVDRKLRTITIPCGLYRNLVPLIDDLLKNGKGQIVWASDDGCFDGCYICNNGTISSKTFNLYEWALDHGWNAKEVTENPETDKDFDIRDDIIDEFIACYT